MDTSKYVNIKDMALEFLGESFGEVAYGIVPEKGHESEAFCQTCGDAAAQYVAEGKATFHETLLACKLTGEMIADVWETRKLANDIKHDIEAAMNRYTKQIEAGNCKCVIFQLIDERTCDGKLYNACIEQIIDIIEDIIDDITKNKGVVGKFGDRYSIYLDMTAKLKSYLEVK